MSDPYRTPGEVVTPEEQRARWQRELDHLNLTNVSGMSVENRLKLNKRCDELQQLLNSPPPQLPVASRIDAVKAWCGMFISNLSGYERREIFDWLGERYCLHCGDELRGRCCHCTNDE